MIQPTDPTKICLYHKNCWDGICSAWVVSKRFPKDVFYQPLNYGDDWRGIIFPLLNKPVGIRPDIIMVDFSLKRDELDELSKFTSLLVLDHHKTAEAELKGAKYAIFDMNESGASLAWKYFFPNQQIPTLVAYIKDRDLWQFKLPDSEIINSYIQSYPMTIENYEQLFQELLEPEGINNAFIGGSAINRYKQTAVEAMCQNAMLNNDGIPVANASVLFSEVGSELCKQYPEAKYSMYYFDRLTDGIRQWGLRSIGDYDVSEVAKLHGGGGHKNAAGFTSPLINPGKK